MKYGLIGEHLPHSYSKEIHNALAPYEYQLCELTPEEVDAFMRAHAFDAINVTIPYKETVLPYLAEIDEHARLIGAVNTIVNRDGKLYGYNTDFYGMQTLLASIPLSLTDKKVLILGTGGTAKTAHAVAKASGAREIVTVSRRDSEKTVTYADAYAHHTDADVIINTTPCGMFPYPDGNGEREGTPIDISRFPALSGVVDAIYNPLRPNLILDARERGIPAEGGLMMLVAQAIRAVEIFLDTDLDRSAAPRVCDKIRADKENIVLTGMPASGKSTVGQALADLLDRPFFDSDTEIVKKVGKSIPDIFAEVGEAGFRAMETEVIREIAARNVGCVISTGGGAILRDENIRALKRNGRIYFLDRPLEMLIPTPDRPLSQDNEAIRHRYDERYERYCATCDVRISNGGTPDEAIAAIRKDFFHEDLSH